MFPRLCKCIANVVQEYLRSRGYRYRRSTSNDYITITVFNDLDEKDLDRLMKRVETKCKCICRDLELKNEKGDLVEYWVFEDLWWVYATMKIRYEDDRTIIRIYPGWLT